MKSLFTNLSVAGLAACALAALGSSTALGQDAGPEFGNNKITSKIATLTARADLDDYGAELAAGETLSVAVGVAKKSPLRLSVTVLDPDGVDRTGEAKVKVKKGGVKVSVANLAVDKTGRWIVRIGGTDGTEGEYTAKFKVKPAKPQKLKKQGLGGSDPAQREHAFGALSGSLLDVSVKGKKKAAFVGVRDLRGPLGSVSGLFGDDDTALVVKGANTKLKKHPLDAGTGEYVLELGADGAATYTAVIKIRGPARPRGKQRIVSGNDPHLDDHGAPTRSAAGQPVEISGRNFALSPYPAVFFGPFEAVVQNVSPARDKIVAIVPPGADGTTQNVMVINPDGQSAFAEDFIVYVPEARVDNVSIVDGPVLRDNLVRREGGAVLEVTGEFFETADVVTLNDVVVGRQGPTSTTFRVAVPQGPAGTVTLQLTDVFGRVQTIADVAHRVGFEDETTARSPGASFIDDLSAFDAAIGDLDRDGRVDDLVIVTYNGNSRLYPNYVPSPYYLNGVSEPENGLGTRSEYLRVFSTDSLGRLVDDTGDFVPSAGSDDEGVEDWNGLAVALGDLDGADGPDIVLAGAKGASDTSDFFPNVRVLLNNGAGNFMFDPALSPQPLLDGALVAADATYVPLDDDDQGEDPPPDPEGLHLIRGPRTGPALAVALAIGDLDGDDVPDIVTGSPGIGYSYVFYDESVVDFTQSPPYVDADDLVVVDDGFYFSGTRVLENRLDQGGALVDVTESWMPSAGTTSSPGLPAFPARDLALGDVDGDLDLDLIVTFNNPAAVIPSSAAENYGAYARYSYGRYQYFYDAASAVRAVATRVLINNGSGLFTDVTSTWLPPGSGDEWWQAHRVAFADLDGDDDPDLVLLHRRALNEYRYNASDGTPPAAGRSSLRVLRNDGTAFTDVTSTALPSEALSLRGNALAVLDVDGDGRVELLVGTRFSLDDGSGNAVRSTKVLWGGDGLTFALRDEFLPGVDVDSGEVTRVLVGDLDRDDLPDVFFLNEKAPESRPDAELLRIFEWRR